MNDKHVTCRMALARDYPAIRDIVASAFGRQDEADLVETLRARGDIVLEAVAEDGPSPCAHVVYSRVRVNGESAGLRFTMLAPASVRPDRQRRGVGLLLARTSMAWLRNGGEDAVLVLGDPKFYGRLDFTAERAAGIIAPWSGPSFMAAALSDKVPAQPRGRLEGPAPLLRAG